MFNPKEQERQLREELPTFDAAKTRAEQAKEDLAEPLMKLFDQLRDELDQMPIAERFSSTKVIGNNIGGDASFINPARAHLTEAEFKRQQLVDDVEDLRRGALLLAANLEQLILEIEATKLD